MTLERRYLLFDLIDLGAERGYQLANRVESWGTQRRRPAMRAASKPPSCGDPGRSSDRCHHAQVNGAAAEVAVERLNDLIVGRVRMRQ